MKNVSHSEQFSPFFLYFGLGSLIIVSNLALSRSALKVPGYVAPFVPVRNTSTKNLDHKKFRILLPASAQTSLSYVKLRESVRAFRCVKGIAPQT